MSQSFRSLALQYGSNDVSKNLNSWTYRLNCAVGLSGALLVRAKYIVGWSVVGQLSKIATLIFKLIKFNLSVFFFIAHKRLVFFWIVVSVQCQLPDRE